MMIQSFGSSETKALFNEKKSRRFAAIARVAARKLYQLNRAGLLTDLAVPPGNHLEALRGRGSGWHSIRINDQWRIVFKWTVAGPEKVEIVDYH